MRSPRTRSFIKSAPQGILEMENLVVNLFRTHRCHAPSMQSIQEARAQDCYANRKHGVVHGMTRAHLSIYSVSYRDSQADLAANRLAQTFAVITKQSRAPHCLGQHLSTRASKQRSRLRTTRLRTEASIVRYLALRRCDGQMR